MLVGSELLQLIKRDLVQSLLVRGIQEDLGHDLGTLWVVLVCIKGFSPSVKVMLVSYFSVQYHGISES